MVTATCTVFYGASGTDASPTGIKIFQKGSDFNKYTEPDLGSVDANTEELVPFFVIYDCSTTGCTQTSGFVKYKLRTDSTTSKFVNCYTQKDIDTSNVESDIPSVIGCIPLNKDETLGKSGAMDCKAANVAKATSGTCKFNDATGEFNMCIVAKIGAGTAPSDYEFKEISVTAGEEGQFFFTNGDTPFPNTVKNGNVFAKINENAVVLNKCKLRELIIYNT